MTRAELWAQFYAGAILAANNLQFVGSPMKLAPYSEKFEAIIAKGPAQNGALIADAMLAQFEARFPDYFSLQAGIGPLVGWWRCSNPKCCYMNDTVSIRCRACGHPK